MPIGKPQGKDDIGKIFIGGLAISTTSDGLKNYFEKFGEVTDCVLMTDPMTKRSRCFGFITFRDPSVVEKVVSSRPHYLDDKKIDPKPAVPRGPGQGQQQNQGRGPAQRGNPDNDYKVFVGGLSHSATKEDLTEVFSAYGKVTNVNLMMDKETQKMRGFGFVTFESKESVAKAAAEQYHTINGKTVEAKRVEQREPKPRQGQQGHMGNPLAIPMHPAMGAAQFGGQFGYGAMPGMGRGYGAAAGQVYGYGAVVPGAAAYGYGAAALPNGAGFAGAGYGTGREAAAVAGYGALAGLGSYQQTESQYGPARSSYPAEPSYGAYAGAAAVGGAGGFGSTESFGRGGGAAARGFHPYGR